MANKKQITAQIVEKKNGEEVLMIGSQEFEFDGEEADLTGQPIPDIPISELPEDICFRWDDENVTTSLSTSYDKGLKRSSGDLLAFFEFGWSVEELGEIVEHSVETHPAYGKGLSLEIFIEDPYRLRGSICAHIEGVTLKEVVANARQLLAEIFQPVQEIESRVDSLLKDKKKSRHGKTARGSAASKGRS